MDLQELIADVEESSDDPLERLEAASALKDEIEHVADELLDHFVKEARAAGCSWTQIGGCLGVTRQAAQQRQGGLIGRLVQGLAQGKFQRFTPRARAAVIAAQTAARDRNHSWVGTEHLLLGLYAGGDNLAVAALDRLGVERAVVERRVDERLPSGEEPVRGHIPFTPRAKQALELSLREALWLGHNYLGTEHIVLAIRQIDEGVAAQILAELDVTADRLRETIVGLLASGWRPPPTSD
jgi:Clp amino terminal domain, pathogenicity island component